MCAYDRQTQTDVAIKIIKSKHAFMVQARTEIKLLQLTGEKDRSDDQIIVRLLDTFVFRKHQCLVFEMLSYNLYELLKNTRSQITDFFSSVSEFILDFVVFRYHLSENLRSKF